MIYLLKVIVVLFLLSAPANAFPIIGEQQTGISEMTNASAPNKVYTSLMFEHWNRPSLRAPTWSYNDPAAWSNLAGASCGGSQQSPINIFPRWSVKKAFPKFRFYNYGNFDGMNIMNNGHTVVFSLPNTVAQENIPYFTGGGLTGQYEFHSFHLHWGSDSSRGSEHLIKSKSYPAELHLVHYNTKYDDFATATGFQDGLAVLGIFLTVGSSDNEFLTPLVDQLYEVVVDSEDSVLTNLVSFRGLLPKKTGSFYRYSGSLTTPNCNEIVTWTVFEHPLKVSERQLNKFRNLKDAADDSLVNNYRPAQRLEGRVVFYRRFTGCDLSETRPLAATYLWETFKWGQCLVSYALTWPQSILPFTGWSKHDVYVDRHVFYPHQLVKSLWKANAFHATITYNSLS